MTIFIDRLSLPYGLTATETGRIVDVIEHMDGKTNKIDPFYMLDLLGKRAGVGFVGKMKRLNIIHKKGVEYFISRKCYTVPKINLKEFFSEVTG